MFAGSSLRILPGVNNKLSRVSSRNTWVLRRVYAPEPTINGVQRDPTELPNLQKLEVVEFETKKSAGPLKVILLQDIESIGNQFDVVDVDRKLARSDLLLTGKAVYASPFDLKFYAAMKEKMADELASRVRIPFDILSVGRELQKLVVPIKVSMENSWTIDKRIVKTSLRQVGVDLPDQAIFLRPESISGPNFDIEARLLRFYVVISQQYIVPMLGRISHISVDDRKQILNPVGENLPTDGDLAKCGIQREESVYSKTPDYDEGFDVVEFMEQKSRKN